jgi:hypothetical protein
MINIIGRTLFWFDDEKSRIQELTSKFFGLGTLLNRLMNEKYEGKKIKFININFATKEKYLKYPKTLVDSINYYGGHLAYYGIIDFLEFNKFSEVERTNFIWQKSYEYLQICSKEIKNNQLLDASEYAYKKGLEMKLNPDYRMVENDVIIFGKQLKACIWLNFREDGMYSKLTLEDKERIIFEKDIDSTEKGIEFFLIMYKSIQVKGNIIIIKGRSDVEGLPLKVLISVDEINW